MRDVFEIVGPVLALAVTAVVLFLGVGAVVFAIDDNRSYTAEPLEVNADPAVARCWVITYRNEKFAGSTEVDKGTFCKASDPE